MDIIDFSSFISEEVYAQFPLLDLEMLVKTLVFERLCFNPFRVVLIRITSPQMIHMLHPDIATSAVMYFSQHFIISGKDHQLTQYSKLSEH